MNEPKSFEHFNNKYIMRAEMKDLLMKHFWRILINKLNAFDP